MSGGREGTKKDGTRARGYEVVMLELVQAGEFKPGVSYAVDVRHDEWCALLAGHGECNCYPDLVIHRLGDKPGGVK